MPLYRLLLFLYPKGFRDEYSGEMIAVLRASLRQASGGGVALLWLRTMVWLGAVADVLWNAPQVQAEYLAQDLKYAVRSLSRAAAFTATVVTVAALAVGAAAAAITVADRVFLNPLPFPEPGRLVRLWEAKPGYATMEISPANFRDWKSQSRSFEALAAWRGQAGNLTGRDRPLHLEGSSVTADLFPALGVRPLIGRTFLPEDDRAESPATILLSESLWRERFAGDPAMLGRTLYLDGRPHTVIGVLPASFKFPSRTVRFWTAMRFQPIDFEDRGNNYLHSVARLAPGVGLDGAREEMRSIAANLAREYPQANEKTGVTMVALSDQVGARSKTMLTTVCAAALCFLLIACLNLGGLFAARALGRRREIAIRRALGAGAERIARQLATESFLVASIGGALGLAVAAFILPFLGRLVPATLPVELPSLDWRSAGWTVLLTLAAGTLFGVLPAWRAGRDVDGKGLREGSRQGVGGRRQGARSALVVAEVSLSIALLVGAGLLIRALWSVRGIDPGFRPEGVLTLATPLPMPKYEKTEKRTQFYDRVLAEVKALPGVRSAAYISFLPMQMGGGIWPVEIGGRTHNRAEGHTASMRFVTPGYFDAMGIPLLRGRDAAASDTMSSGLVAVVSESFAQRYWPGQDPIGRAFKFAVFERRIVGVVADIKMRGLERSSEPQVYLPYRQNPDNAFTWYAPKSLVVSGGGEANLPAIRRIIAEADPEQPITQVESMAAIVEGDTAARLLQVRMLAAFAAMAVLLASLGLYGLLSHSVSSRTPEFGMRMALGAQGIDVFRLVFWESAILLGVGVGLGVGLAAAAARALSALLYGVGVADPVAWGAGISLCVAGALAGSLIPALRAARIDPMEAIRRE
jgi:putative ABC transport system permease protein